MGLATLFLLFLLRVLLRREWAAAVLFIAITTAFFARASDSSLTWIVGTFEWAIAYFIMTRFGLLTLTKGYAFANLLYRFPITSHLSAWYAGIGLAAVMLTGQSIMELLTLLQHGILGPMGLAVRSCGPDGEAVAQILTLDSLLIALMTPFAYLHAGIWIFLPVRKSAAASVVPDLYGGTFFGS